MLAVFLAAVPLYPSTWSHDHPHVIAFMILITLILAVCCSIYWLLGKRQERSKTSGDVGTMNVLGSSNVGHQVAGNVGPVHIGDNFHQASSPPSTQAKDYSAEWRKLADDMRADCRFLRADWSMNNILGESWDVKGADNRRVCQAWIRRAGKMLLISPAVCRSLPENVRNDPDDLHRWLRYLKERYHFEHSHYLTGTCDDGRKEKIMTGSVPDLAEQSFKACVDCSTYEL